MSAKNGRHAGRCGLSGIARDAPGEAPDRAIVAFVASSGLLPGETVPVFRRLGGGISSDIWLVRAGEVAFCVKRALPQLRVAVEWRVPTERNASEAAWFNTVVKFMPESVPRVLAQDAATGAFAMQYLPAEDYPNWKALLLAGRVDPAAAAEVGRRLARIHSATAKSPALAARFATDAIFHAIRLDAYLLATARVHLDLAPILQHLAVSTAYIKCALVHGDVSPKNILMGPSGPVFIDAECAWYGDPAFDLSFCLKHLLLKCLVVPGAAADLLTAFACLSNAYCAGIDWEDRRAYEARVASLLPGLFLARVDGKSPVEYLRDERDRERVRRVARALLRDPPAQIAAVGQAWREELGSEFVS